MPENQLKIGLFISEISAEKKAAIMKAFVPRILNSTCPLGTPSELEGAYGNPSSFLLLACFWVVLRSSTPLIVSLFRQVKGLVSAVSAKLLGFVRKRSETVEDGVALTPTAETQTNC